MYVYIYENVVSQQTSGACDASQLPPDRLVQNIMTAGMSHGNSLLSPVIHPGLPNWCSIIQSDMLSRFQHCIMSFAVSAHMLHGQCRSVDICR